jgi:hypothetical protein
MEDLTQKRIAFKPKNIGNQPHFSGIRIVACVPLSNDHTEEEFLNIEFTMKPTHSLTGKVVYHNVIENIAVVEVEDVNLSLELDLDLFSVTPL